MRSPPTVRFLVVVGTFLLMYNLEVKGVPGSSVYAGLALLLLTSWRTPLPLDRREIQVLILGIAMFSMLSVARWLAGSSIDVVLRAQYVTVFAVGGGLALYAACGGRIATVLRTVTYAGAIQGVFVVLTYGFRPARVVVDKVLVQSGNISLLLGSRPSGFTNSSGALLSVTQAVAACAGLIWLWSSPSRPRGPFRVVIVATAICVVSSVLAGRTGIIVLFVMLGGRALRNPKVVAAAAGLVMLGSAGLIFAPSITPESSALYPQFVDSRRQMLDLLKLWRGEFFDVFSKMPWPRFGFNLLSGDPQYFAAGRPTHDSGIVQTFGSMGLAAALIVYAAVAYFAWQSRRAHLPGLTALCWIVVGLEWKEPFIFKGPNLAIIVAVATAAHVEATAVSRRRRVNVATPTPRRQSLVPTDRPQLAG